MKQYVMTKKPIRQHDADAFDREREDKRHIIMVWNMNLLNQFRKYFFYCLLFNLPVAAE